jgi:GT2 family glycosyltransferase
VAEIIVVSKATINLNAFCSDERVKLVIAPEAGLSEARNLGISKSSNDIVAFTDDDCTVAPDWPQHALGMFDNPEVGIVGGPGVTHPNDGWKSKCSGAVLSTRLGTSSSVYRYSVISDHPVHVREKQLSTCNIFFRKRVLEEHGHFHSALQTCEENELIERIRSAGYSVLYVPACVVYHHRRPLFVPFLKQIVRYAIGRAKFILEWPQYLNPICLLPSIWFSVTVALLILSVFYLQAARAIAILLAIYLITIAIAASRSTAKNRLKLRFAPLIFLGVISMHYLYGLSFLAGLCNSVGAALRLLCSTSKTI